jgi:hypothetical protein
MPTNFYSVNIALHIETGPDTVCILAISNVDTFTLKYRLLWLENYNVNRHRILNTSNPMTEPNSVPWIIMQLKRTHFSYTGCHTTLSLKQFCENGVVYMSSSWC